MHVDVVPIDASDPGQRPLVEEWSAVRAACETHSVGEHATPYTADEVIAYATEPSMDRRYWAAIVDDRVVGALVVVLPRLDDQPVGFIGVHVHPDHRRRGIGTDLFDRGEEQIRQGGRRQACATTHFDRHRGDEDAAFLEHRGYRVALRTLESELLLSRVPAPLPSPAGYTVAAAEGVPPTDWLGDLAWLMSRMSTDAPQGEIEWSEEVWDAERYTSGVQTQLDAGRRVFTAVARHEASGRLAAFTVNVVPAASPHLALQHETLVVREHRGHGLGRAVKERLMVELGRRAPAVQLVRTFNAESNVHMLAVNADLGYEVVAAESDWQKAL